MKEKQIQIHKILTAEETEVGIGAIFNLQNTAPIMIKFLREQYLNDKKCISGDIDYLFTYNGKGITDKHFHYKP